MDELEVHHRVWLQRMNYRVGYCFKRSIQAIEESTELQNQFFGIVKVWDFGTTIITIIIIYKILIANALVSRKIP